MIAMPAFVKTRARAEPGSIPDVLEIFENEIRFYREIAPVVGVRTPALLAFDSTSDQFTLELEDLSTWREGGEPAAVARELKMLHERWQDEAERQWPWLNRSGRAADLIGDLYDGVWRELRDRSEFSPNLLTLGDSLAGALAGLEREESVLPHRTLIHGDAALGNVRTSPTGEIAFLDWEDVRVTQGEADLAWLLVSSVDGDLWSAVLEAYSPQPDTFLAALRGAAAQGVLSLSDHPDNSPEALGWVARLEVAAAVLV